MTRGCPDADVERAFADGAKCFCTILKGRACWRAAASSGSDRGYAHRPWVRRLTSMGIAHPTMAHAAPGASVSSPGAGSLIVVGFMTGKFSRPR
jgi:hypothetical protein